MNIKLFVVIPILWMTNYPAVTNSEQSITPPLFPNILKEANSVTEEEFCYTWTIVVNYMSENFIQSLIHSDDTNSKAFAIYRANASLSEVTESSELYFDKMYTSAEILQSGFIIRSMRLSRPCAIVFISKDRHKCHTKLIQSVMLEGFARSNQDYFVFIQNELTTEIFPTTKVEEDIRYKYFYWEAPDSKGLVDTCAVDGLSTLFLRKCNIALNGKHLVIASVRGTPWLTFEYLPDGSLLGGSGIYFKLFTDSAQLFNFTMEFKYANNGGSSGFKRNGSWFGNVGEVYHRTADIGVGSGLTSHRDSAIDSGVPFEDISRIFFIKAASPAVNWKAILAPFKTNVWLLILATALLLVPLYFLSLIFEYTKDGTIYTNNNGTMRHLNTAILSLTSILLDQEVGAKTWIGFRIKFAVFLWMFFCLVIGAGYRSRLVYFLTFSESGQVPLTHTALIEQNYKLLYRYYGGVAFKQAMDSKDPMQHEIVRRAILINSSQECIVEAILQENSACLDWDEHGSYASYTNATIHERQTKDLIIKAKDSVMDGVWIAWIFRNMSPLMTTFDSYLLATFASGIYSKWVQEDWSRSKLDGARWLNANSQLPANKKIIETFGEYTSSIRALALSSLYGVFGMLILSCIIANLVFVVEITIRCIQRK